MTRDWTPTDAAEEADDQRHREWWKRARLPSCPDTDQTYCPHCGEPCDDPDVEAFEITGELVCRGCASGDDGQPDEQQEWGDYDPDC